MLLQTGSIEVSIGIKTGGRTFSTGLREASRLPEQAGAISVGPGRSYPGEVLLDAAVPSLARAQSVLGLFVLP